VTFNNTGGTPDLSERELVFTLMDVAGNISNEVKQSITMLPAQATYADTSAPQLGHASAGDAVVNTTTSSNQTLPKSAALTDGGYVTVWAGNQSGTYDVYGQRFDKTGARVGAEFQANTYTANSQGAAGTNDANLDVTGLAGGGYVVTWASDLQDGGSWGVYARNYDAQGHSAGAEYRVNTTTASLQWVPQTTGLTGGGYVIVWASASQDGDGYGVYAQRYNSAGVAQGSEFRVNVVTASDQGARAAGEEGLSVTRLSDGGFAVSWYSTTGGTGDVYARLYNADGTARTGEFQVNTYTTGWQWTPQTTVLANGQLLVTWASEGQDGSGNGLYGQRFDLTGAALGDEFIINTTVSGQQGNLFNGRAHDVVGLADGGWVATWYDSAKDGSSGGIYMQRFDANGTMLGTETLVNSVTSGDQRSPTVVALVDGGYAISWASDAQDGWGYGVYQKVYEANGLERQSRPSNDILVNSNTASDQFVPKNVALADGGHVVVWASNHGGTYDVYGQRYDANGQKVGVQFLVNSVTTGTQGVLVASTYVPQLDVIGLSGGGFVVTFAGDASSGVTGSKDGNVWGVFARRYDATGTTASAEERVNTYTTSDQLVPQGASLADGGYVIAWASNGQDTSGYGVYAQRYNSEGVAQGSEFRVNVTTSGNQGSRDGENTYEESLSVTGLKGGGFAVAWSSANEVYTRIYDASGTALTSEFLVNSTTANTQWLPQVAALASGGYIVTWADSATDGSGYGLYAQRLSASGQLVGSEFRINTTTLDDQGGWVDGQDDRLHDVAGLAGGGFVAVWCSEAQDGAQGGMYMQVYDAAGNKVGAETRVNTVTAGTQRHVNVAALADGGYTVAWDSYNQDATNTWGVYQKSFNADGSERVGNLWHVGGAAVAVAPGLVGITLDANTAMGGAVVEVSNYKAGDELAFTAVGDITGAYDGAGTLTLSGAGTLAQYQTALRSVTFNNTGGTPDLSERELVFTLADAAGNASQPIAVLLSLFDVAQYLTDSGTGSVSGGAGVDSLIGNATTSNLLAGAGDDFLFIADASFSAINGGVGHDTLVFNGGTGFTLDLTTLAANAVQGIEAIHLGDSTSVNNSLTVNLASLLNLSDTSNHLIVNGSAGDVVQISSAGTTWTDIATESMNGRTYEVYSNSADSSVRLFIATQITQTIIG
jgi:hypothetical protein